MDDKIETHFPDKKMNFNFCHNSKQSYFIKIMKWFYFVFNSCLQGSQIHRSTSKRQCKYLIALRNPQLSIRLRQLINRLAGFIYRSVLPVSFTVKNRKTYISEYVLIFKRLLWNSELGWRIIMRCFSEWRTIPDKQRKIYLARLGFESKWLNPNEDYCLDSNPNEDYCLDIEETSICFEIWNSPSIPSFDDQLPTWPVAQLVEHRTSNRRSRVRIPAGLSRFFSACAVWFLTRRNISLL